MVGGIPSLGIPTLPLWAEGVFLFWAAVHDFRTFRIPTQILFTGILAWLLLALIHPALVPAGLGGLNAAFVLCLLGYLFLRLLNRFMGNGDYAMFLLSGLYLGGIGVERLFVVTGMLYAATVWASRLLFHREGPVPLIPLMFAAYLLVLPSLLARPVA